MSEEKILFKKDNEIVGITKEGQMYESFNPNTRNILRGAKLYIEDLQKKLQQSQQKLDIAITDLQKVKDFMDYRGDCSTNGQKLYVLIDNLLTKIKEEK